MLKQQRGLGLRKASLVSDSFMLKIAWEISTKPYDLWVKVLKGKYGCGVV